MIARRVIETEEEEEEEEAREWSFPGARRPVRRRYGSSCEGWKSSELSQIMTTTTTMITTVVVVVVVVVAVVVVVLLE
jgi:hypothetical protein